MRPILKYIQYLAQHPNRKPSQEEYEKDFGGTENWYSDAVNACRFNIPQLKRELEKAGVGLGADKKSRTTGMRRQYLFDCIRTNNIIELT